ncbi:Bug family tripartite tricarboxylate transporter substrate binding protein [Comamonas sp. B21-038]|uniref:Bug family tripartite tricarboxylate transporter substrate binding protein n=1 Tax=Comamonas sp. B21-038 TaxID=2918299 RepID=UPI001EFA6016|nr:tripartite tricarboxylate transporter substrate binding protein [Comamonas sp. B21-038]ULR91108.1 tripartite tricarboxylate transporter substrate binding protein [Comamonas sp. B21-038]
MPVSRRQFHHRLVQWGAAASLASPWLARGADAPLRWVVPYPAGGAADQITRIVAQDVGQSSGQPIVIENKAGAAGMIAAETALRAPADGLTFFVGSNAPLVINSAIYAKMSYDPVKDFVPVAGLGKAPLLLVTRKDLGASDLRALIALAQQAQRQGKTLSMGSAGSGNITHLAGEYASERMGFQVTHVPFSGSAPAITSMMGGNVDIMFDALPSCMQQAMGGRIVPLALLDKQRFAALPQVPTLAELGFGDTEASAWFGVVARSGTPADAVARMARAIHQSLAKPEVQERLRRIGAQPMAGSTAEWGQFVASERERWIPVAQKLGIRAE